MSIVSVVAGAYTGAWGTGAPFAALNYTRRGFNVAFQQKAQLVNETDLYGDTLIDKVYRGGGCRVDTVGKVYGSGTITPFSQWQFHVSTPGLFGGIWAPATPIARLATQVAHSLVLTVVASTSAAGNPTTATFTKCIISEESLRMVFSSEMRDVPLSWDVLPSETAIAPFVGSFFIFTP